MKIEKNNGTINAPKVDGDVDGENVNFGNQTIVYGGQDDTPIRLDPNPNARVGFLDAGRVIGRDAMLADLHETLRGQNSVAVTAVNGQGGVGKTTVARAYAQRYRDAYQGGLWCTAVSAQNIADGVKPFYATWSGTQLPDAQTLPPSQAAQILDALPDTGKPWLLVLDNVVDYAAIQHMIPQNAPVHTLITSRRTEGWGTIPCKNTDVLGTDGPDSDAVTLLIATKLNTDDPAQIAAERGSPAIDDIVGVAQDLGGLALALVHAATLMAQ
ncbi:MAG: ATP-binding protein, partial [Pseudomonadota bacterium]